jgi:hypothetical protein
MGLLLLHGQAGHIRPEFVLNAKRRGRADFPARHLVSNFKLEIK